MSILTDIISPDLAIDNTNCAETIFIEVINPNGSNLVVGVIYRPPNGSIQEFLNCINKLTSAISKENKHSYIMGDFNLDLLNYHSHQYTGEFLDIMYSNTFFPLITRPTRITSYSATLIDNIFTNNIKTLSSSGLLFTDISDHLPIFGHFCDQFVETNRDTYVTFHDKSASNILKFKTLLENNNWSNILGQNDPNYAYSNFHANFIHIYNISFPLKAIKAVRYKRNKPWLSNEILKSIKKKNALYKKSLHALTNLLNKITTAFDEKKLTIGIFLDLSKAFDTVDHEILFQKLEHYGIRGLALEWVRSYFSDRQQFVEFNGLHCFYSQTNEANA